MSDSYTYWTETGVLTGWACRITGPTTKPNNVPPSRYDYKVGATTVVGADGWRPPTAYIRDVRDYATTGTQLSVRLTTEAKLPRPAYLCNPSTFHCENRIVALTVPTAPSYPTGLMTRAEIECLLKLKDRGATLAEDWAERRQTISMVYNILKRVVTAVRYARRLQWVEVARTLGVTPRQLRDPRNWASSWLEYKYGWLPLYQTAYDLVEMLHDNDMKRPKRYTVHVIRNLVEEAEFSKTNDYSLWPTYFLHHIDVKREVRWRAKVRLDYYLVNPLLATLSQLGITNPVSLAWNLLPFSFVADWWLPIGDYLNALDAQLGWAFRGGSATRVTHSTCRVEFSGFTPKNYGGHVGGGPTIEEATPLSNYHTVEMQRDVYETAPFPDLPFYTKDWFRGERLATLAALFVQLVK